MKAVYHLIIRDTANPPHIPTVRLRKVLKAMLRSYGFRNEKAEELMPEQRTKKSDNHTCSKTKYRVEYPRAKETSQAERTDTGCCR
jgi:hypothetical protein